MSRETLVRFARSDALADDAVATRCEAALDPRERAAMERLRPTAARRDYLASHALLRWTLAERLGGGPETQRFTVSQHGRPEVTGGPAFSIARADGWVVCAVAADGPVGVDVESVRRAGDDDLLGAAAIVFSSEELDALRSVNGARRVARFLAVWTLKEAYAKAIGLGFHARLDRVTVHVDGPDAPRITFATENPHDRGRWQLRTFDVADGVVGAVAGAGGVPHRIEETSISSLVGFGPLEHRG